MNRTTFVFIFAMQINATAVFSHIDKYEILFRLGVIHFPSQLSMQANYEKVQILEHMLNMVTGYISNKKNTRSSRKVAVPANGDKIESHIHRALRNLLKQFFVEILLSNKLYTRHISLTRVKLFCKYIKLIDFRTNSPEFKKTTLESYKPTDVEIKLFKSIKGDTNALKLRYAEELSSMLHREFLFSICIGMYIDFKAYLKGDIVCNYALLNEHTLGKYKLPGKLLECVKILKEEKKWNAVTLYGLDFLKLDICIEAIIKSPEGSHKSLVLIEIDQNNIVDAVLWYMNRHKDISLKDAYKHSKAICVLLNIKEFSLDFLDPNVHKLHFAILDTPSHECAKYYNAITKLTPAAQDKLADDVFWHVFVRLKAKIQDTIEHRIRDKGFLVAKISKTEYRVKGCFRPNLLLKYFAADK